MSNPKDIWYCRDISLGFLRFIFRTAHSSVLYEYSTLLYLSCSGECRTVRGRYCTLPGCWHSVHTRYRVLYQVLYYSTYSTVAYCTSVNASLDITRLVNEGATPCYCTVPILYCKYSVWMTRFQRLCVL